MKNQCRLSRCKNIYYVAGYCKEHFSIEIRKGIKRRQEDDLNGMG